MTPKKHIWLVLVVALGLVLAGCGGAARLARSKAAAEYSCPKEGIEVKDIGRDRFRVLACGNMAIYMCDNLTKVCTREEGDAP